jgi:transketolase
VFDDNYQFKLGKADTLVDGKDAVIFATGIMMKNALEAASVLKQTGISVKVVNVHTIKPLDFDGVVKAARETGAVVTVENHNILNGLGSAVAEVISENCPVPMRRIGIKDQFGEVGMMDYLEKRFELTALDIVKAANEVIIRKQENRGKMF